MHRASIGLYDATEAPISRQDAEARRLAISAANNGRLLVLPPIPEELHLTGARLTSVTQALAYGTIKSLSESRARPRTQKMIRDIKVYVKSVNGTIPNDCTIWKGIRSKDFS